MQEKWKKLDDYPYEISDMGRLRHIKHKKIRKYRVNSSGYYQTTLVSESTKKKDTVIVHRLVATYFLSKHGKGFVADHINRNRLDNRAANLRIVSYKDNSANKISIDQVYKHLGLIDEGITMDELRKHLASRL